MDWKQKRPAHGIEQIQFIGNQWTLHTNKGGEQNYDRAEILINNELFQLLQFRNAHTKKLLVLFHDQMSKHQSVLLQLKIAQN